VSPTRVTSATLTEFVFHSNWIEGYPPYEYNELSPLFRNHLAAAKRVVASQEWDPQVLHTILFGGTGLGFLNPADVGIFRRVQVYIGDFYPPSPGDHLLRHVTRWKARVEAGPGDGDTEQWCWSVHDEYECCHPFVDGNGRTGRLILNALRLKYGLPWLIVHQGDEQQKYYRHIGDYQHSGRWRCSQWHPDEGWEGLLDLDARKDRPPRP
jgi:hypothetical protein